MANKKELESKNAATNNTSEIASQGKEVLGNLVGGGNPNLESGEKLLAALGYIGFLSVMPLAIKPKSEFCQLHGKQALVLSIIFLLFAWLGWLSRGMGAFIGILHVIIVLFMIFNAWKGKAFKLPVVSQIAAKIKW